MAMMPRRRFFTAALAAVAVVGTSRRRRALAAPTEIKVPDNVPTTAFDFETTGIEGWSTVAGRWAVEDMAGAPSGKRVLVQRATNNEFNVIVAPGSYADVDVSVKFKPISGREDASGGIVFRFNDGKYYVVRANALEDNFRLYTYDRGRRQLATARVKAPALGHWHTLRPHPGVARWRAAPGPSRLALHRGPRGIVDEGRFDHGLRRRDGPREANRQLREDTDHAPGHHSDCSPAVDVERHL